MTSFVTSELANIVISGEKNRLIRKKFLDAIKLHSMVNEFNENKIIDLNHLPSNISLKKNNAGIVLPISYSTKIIDKQGTENSKYIKFIEYEIPHCGNKHYDFFDNLEDKNNSIDFNHIIYIIDTSEERLYDQDLNFLHFIILKYGENLLKNLIIIHGKCNYICNRYSNSYDYFKKLNFYNKRIECFEKEINNSLIKNIKQLRNYKMSGYKDKSSPINKYIGHIVFFEFGEVSYRIKDNNICLFDTPLINKTSWILDFFRHILRNMSQKLNFYKIINTIHKEKKKKKQK